MAQLCGLEDYYVLMEETCPEPCQGSLKNGMLEIDERQIEDALLLSSSSPSINFLKTGLTRS